MLDGKTLPQAAMASLVAQYAATDPKSDQYKWAMAVQAQSIAQAGVPVDGSVYKNSTMPADNVIDLSKVQKILSDLSKNADFMSKLGKDYQTTVNELVPKYFPTAVGDTQRPLLWAAVNGDAVPKPSSTKQPAPATTGAVPTPSPSGSPSPSASPSGNSPPASQNTPSPTLTPASSGTLARGKTDLQSLALVGLVNGTIDAGTLAASPQSFVTGGVLSPDVLKGVPAAQVKLDHPELVGDSLAVVANIQNTEKGGASSVPYAAGGATPAGVEAQLAFLAKTRPDLTPQQRSDAVGQAFELMGVSNRQASELAKAVAPYLTAPPGPQTPGVPTASPAPAPTPAGTPPQGVALRADAPASAKAAWSALQKIAEMRAALDDTGSTTGSSNIFVNDQALTKNLDRTSLEAAIYGGANTKFSADGIAKAWSDYMSSPEYAKWISSLPPDKQQAQMNSDLENIRSFDPAMADKTANDTAFNLFQQSYKTRLSEIDPGAVENAAYTWLNISRWSDRELGFLGGTSDKDVQQFAKYWATTMQRIEAKGANPTDYDEFVRQSQQDGASPKYLSLLEKINKAGAFGSIAGAIDVTAGLKRWNDPNFQKILHNGTNPFDPFDNSDAAWAKRDAIASVINYGVIGASYAEHYARALMSISGASPEAKYKIGLYQTFGQIKPELVEAMRPDLGKINAALKGVNPEDEKAVQAALDGMFTKDDQLVKYRPGIKYDTESFARRYVNAVNQLSKDDKLAVTSDDNARLGFLMDTKEIGLSEGDRDGSTLIGEVDKQAKALTGVNLADQDAVKAALVKSGYLANDADVLAYRIANTADKTAGKTTNTLQTYGRLIEETYANAPDYSDAAIAKTAQTALTSNNANTALEGILDIGQFKVASGMPNQALAKFGLYLKGGVAGLDTVAALLSGYMGVRDVISGFNQKDMYGNSLPNNYGIVAGGAVEVASFAPWLLGALGEAGVVDAATGPFFVLAMGLTFVGGVMVYAFGPDQDQKNKEALEGFFKPYDKMGLMAKDWKTDVDNWAMSNQRDTAIEAPGQLNGPSPKTVPLLESSLPSICCRKGENVAPLFLCRQAVSGCRHLYAGIAKLWGQATSPSSACAWHNPVLHTG
jgi:hypothetical protein